MSVCKDCGAPDDQGCYKGCASLTAGSAPQTGEKRYDWKERLIDFVEAQPLPPSEARECAERGPQGFVCSLRANHDGDHRALAAGFIPCETWPQPSSLTASEGLRAQLVIRRMSAKDVADRLSFEKRDLDVAIYRRAEEETLSDVIELLDAALAAAPRMDETPICIFKGDVDGCNGNGRPSCTATECMAGVEPCPECPGFKPIGKPCNFVHKAPRMAGAEDEQYRVVAAELADALAREAAAIEGLETLRDEWRKERETARSLAAYLERNEQDSSMARMQAASAGAKVADLEPLIAKLKETT
jgi:hypothetical protein